MVSSIRWYKVVLQHQFLIVQKGHMVFSPIISHVCPFFTLPVLWGVFFTPVASFQTDDRHRKKQSKLPVMYSGKMKKSSWSFLEEKHF